MGQRSESALLSQKRLCTIATNQLRAREDLHHRRNKRSKRIGPVAAKHLFRLFLEPASNLHARRRTPCISTDVPAQDHALQIPVLLSS